MKTFPMRIAQRTLLTLCVVTSVTGCEDESRRLPGEPGFTEPGIHPVISVVSQTSNSVTAHLSLHRVEVEEMIGSFQGEITYDASRLRLTEASFPEGIVGAWNEVSPGTLRFTGLSATGMDGDRVMLLTFAAGAPMTSESLALRMEEVIASEGFSNLLPSLRQAGDYAAFTPVSR